MQQLDSVVEVVRMLNRLGIKASAVHILAWGDLAYSERTMYRLLKRLCEQGRIVKIAHKRGYAVAAAA